MSQPTVIKIKGNKRLNDEDFDNYRKRIKIENRMLKYFFKFGNMFWNSYKQGSYRKDEK